MKQTHLSEDVGENSEAKPFRRPRRSNKPAMERRRRERINGCLEQLKNYVLVAEGKDPARYTKVEKADILEMTVRFLTSKKSQQRLAATGGNSITPHYSNGYRACVEDLQRLLSSTESPLPSDAKDRLLQHLRGNAASGSIHESSDAAGKRLSEDDSDNCITIRGTYGAGATAKLVVRCTHQPQQHQTVYSTWSPPLASPSSPPGLDGLCSPPSSPVFANGTSSPISSNPECLRTVSNPSGKSPTSPVLSCSVLQPRNPNTHITPSSAPSWASSSSDHSTTFSTSQYINYPKEQALSPQPSRILDGELYNLQSENSNTVCQQFRNLQPFHMSPAHYQSSPSPSPSLAGYDSEYRLCYSPPQSVPLNLAAPKSGSFKEEEEEDVHSSLSPRQVSSSLQQHFRERLPAYPLQQDIHGSDPWRPWFN